MPKKNKKSPRLHSRLKYTTGIRIVKGGTVMFEFYKKDRKLGRTLADGVISGPLAKAIKDLHRLAFISGRQDKALQIRQALGVQGWGGS